MRAIKLFVPKFKKGDKLIRKTKKFVSFYFIQHLITLFDSDIDSELRLDAF